MAGFNRYGYYRYGRSEYRPKKRTREVPEETGPTPEELFGAGIALRSAEDMAHGATEDGSRSVPWDFVADATGDLAATVGHDELRKDLAFATARDAHDLIGTLPSPNEFTRLANDIERVAQRDSRITDAEAEVTLSQRRRGTITAEVEMDAETEELPRMVFPLQA